MCIRVFCAESRRRGPFALLSVDSPLSSWRGVGRKEEGRQQGLSTQTGLPPPGTPVPPACAAASPAPGAWARWLSLPSWTPRWFHVRMSSQVSCSEERDNQSESCRPGRCEAGVYPNFPRS